MSFVFLKILGSNSSALLAHSHAVQVGEIGEFSGQTLAQADARSVAQSLLGEGDVGKGTFARGKLGRDAID